MVAHPQRVVLTTMPVVRQLPRLGLLLRLALGWWCFSTPASAWVSTSPEGDITFRGDTEVRLPGRSLTAPRNLPSLSARSL